MYIWATMSKTIARGLGAQKDQHFSWVSYLQQILQLGSRLNSVLDHSQAALLEAKAKDYISQTLGLTFSPDLVFSQSDVPTV